MLVEDNIHVELKGLKGLDVESKERKIEECSMVVVKSKSMRTEKTEVDETVLMSKYSLILPFSCQKKRHSADSVLYLDLYPLPGQVDYFTYSRADFSYKRIRKLGPNKASRSQ